MGDSEAERLAGNAAFKEKKYAEAIERYTSSLSLQETAVLLCNRALCHAKLEVSVVHFSDVKTHTPTHHTHTYTRICTQTHKHAPCKPTHSRTHALLHMPPHNHTGARELHR